MRHVQIDKSVYVTFNKALGITGASSSLPMILSNLRARLTKATDQVAVCCRCAQSRRTPSPCVSFLSYYKLTIYVYICNYDIVICLYALHHICLVALILKRPIRGACSPDVFPAVQARSQPLLGLPVQHALNRRLAWRVFEARVELQRVLQHRRAHLRGVIQLVREGQVASEGAQ